MNQRLKRYINTHHGKVNNLGLVHHIYKVRTDNREFARTLIALDSHPGHPLTPGYARWPAVADRPQITENDIYEVRIKLRSISHQPGYVRAASVSTIMTALLIIANIIIITMAYDRRNRTPAGGSKTTRAVTQ